MPCIYTPLCTTPAFLFRQNDHFFHYKKVVIITKHYFNNLQDIFQYFPPQNCLLKMETTNLFQHLRQKHNVEHKQAMMACEKKILTNHRVNN